MSKCEVIAIANQNGVRTNKSFGANGEEGYINYYLEGNKIIFEERCKYIDGVKGTNMLYYYQKNYQNDITGIYDSNYNLVVTYKYDAWGRLIMKWILRRMIHPYAVDITMGEKYDFELWPWDKRFSLVNNAGYALQCIGIVKQYDWYINYQIVVEKE